MIGEAEPSKSESLGNELKLKPERKVDLQKL